MATAKKKIAKKTSAKTSGSNTEKNKEEIKRLYRSTKDKKIAGVIGGIAEYLAVDSTILRVLYILLTVFTGFGFGIVAYIIMALIMPENPNEDNE